MAEINGDGTENLDSQEFKDFINEIENRELTVLGAMTAPIKFASWSEDQNAKITPKVDIVKK
ncbi:MAG: hypothetical protein K8R73_04130 [Clostridiales bacterium]|nr:hypothetical protein [Clostridiales bacterium]